MQLNISPIIEEEINNKYKIKNINFDEFLDYLEK